MKVSQPPANTFGASLEGLKVDRAVAQGFLDIAGFMSKSFEVLLICYASTLGGLSSTMRYTSATATILEGLEHFS
jgi:hypothetical protein